MYGIGSAGRAGQRANADYSSPPAHSDASAGYEPPLRDDDRSSGPNGADESRSICVYTRTRLVMQKLEVLWFHSHPRHRLQRLHPVKPPLR